MRRIKRSRDIGETSTPKRLRNPEVNLESCNSHLKNEPASCDPRLNDEKNICTDLVYSEDVPCNQIKYVSGCSKSTNKNNELSSSLCDLLSDLGYQNWGSPIQTQSACQQEATLPNEGFTKASQLYNISESLFESRLQTPKQNANEFKMPPAVLRREVENTFDKLDLSITGVGKSYHSVQDSKNYANALFESRDSFLLDVNEKEYLLKKPEKHFFGLPEQAKSLFATFKNVQTLYDWQNECLNLQVLKERNNLIYALPTSGGKTLVAEILMLKEVLCRKNNVLFVLPFVALVQEKVWSLSPFAVQLDFLIEEYAAGKGCFPPKKRRKKNVIYIATIEKALGLVRSLIEMNRLNEIGLIVVDELHLIGEVSRGSTLEILLASVLYTENEIQIIGMSATIGNISELASFLKAEIYQNEFRPVELKEYVKIGHSLNLVSWSGDGQLEIISQREINFKYSTQVEKMDPDHLGGLVMEVIPNDSCLIFCPTKKNCENVAVLLCKIIFKKLLEHRAQEKRMLAEALKVEGGANSILANTVPWGIAYHHSGLTADERRLLEDAFRAGIISVLCCTSTLAAGVNLPARRVILRSPYVGKNFITLNTYKQMVGRAGRAGFGTQGESIAICPNAQLSQLCSLLSQPMEPALSKLGDTALRALVLSAVSLKLATTRDTVRSLIKSTLLATQADRLEVDLKKVTDSTLKELISSGAIEVKTPGGRDSIHNGSRKWIVYNNSELTVSKLGRAAIKGCMDLKIAEKLYEDLELAQKSLVVMGTLHMLYLVTPYELNDIKPNMANYYSIYSELDAEGVQTAKVLGITESNAVRMVTGKAITNVPELVLTRFYAALMLKDVWNQVNISDVSDKYQVSRGTIQSTMLATSSFAGCVLRFCEEMPEFWAFEDLLIDFTKRIAHCCAPEILPLMDLPNVKKARAMQLHKAGYKRIEDIAKADADTLVQDINHLPRKVATQLISSAKMILLEKVENLREEAEDVMEDLGV